MTTTDDEEAPAVQRAHGALCAGNIELAKELLIVATTEHRDLVASRNGLEHKLAVEQAVRKKAAADLLAPVNP